MRLEVFDDIIKLQENSRGNKEGTYLIQVANESKNLEIDSEEIYLINDEKLMKYRKNIDNYELLGIPNYIRENGLLTIRPRIKLKKKID